MSFHLISIIMPAYCAEKTIECAIHSIQAQTYKNWELIIIDDGSEDTTWNLITNLSKVDERIHCFKNLKNMGVSETRNRGINLASGDWIAFLDSDDSWTSKKLERQIQLLEKQPDAALIFTGSAYINDKGIVAAYHLRVPLQISYRSLLKQNVISCSSVLVKKELMLRYPMKYDDMHEDYAVWLQILKNGGKALGIDEPLLIYRISENSKSSNKKSAAYMTFKVYRFMGLNMIQALYYFSCYACKNIKKHYRIHRSFRYGE